MRRSVKLLVALALVLTVGLGLMALSTPAEAKGGCICPQIYAPVICDHGKTYPNQCVADCRHARNCVPAGIL